MVSALLVMKDRGCGFVVGGRQIGEKFETLEDILLVSDKSETGEGRGQMKLPEVVREMFTGLSETSFRVDLSSSAIRSSEQK